METNLAQMVPRPQRQWEFNVLGLYNYFASGPLDMVFDFLRSELSRIPGDIVELGVYRGKSLLSIALAIEEFGLQRRIFGFDSFSGFPDSALAHMDELDRFDDLAKQGLISPSHFEAVTRNREYKLLKNHSVSIREISTSGDFSSTSERHVHDLAQALGISSVTLVPGIFSGDLFEANLPDSIAVAVFDCDLYKSYEIGLEHVWPRLSIGGICFFDEYYSLKFPGPRRAVSEFLKSKKFEWRSTVDLNCEFERHAIVRTG
jgi:hypothetical protein